MHYALVVTLEVEDETEARGVLADLVIRAEAWAEVVEWDAFPNPQLVTAGVEWGGR